MKPQKINQNHKKEAFLGLLHKKIKKAEIFSIARISAFLFLLWLELVQVLLKGFHKAAYMKPIADTMVYLYGKGHFPVPMVFPCLAQCEYGQEIVIALLQVQVEACECCPWHHGNGEGVGRRIWFCIHVQNVP